MSRPSAPGGYSLTSLFRWIGSCTSPISTLGPNTAVALTSKCFPNSSRNVEQSDLRPLKEKSSPNTDAELSQLDSHQVHHIKHFPVECSSCISQSVHCFQQLVDFASMVTNTALANGEGRCAREISSNIRTSSSPSTCDLGPVIIKLNCSLNTSYGGVAANVAAQSSASIVDRPHVS